MNQSLAGVLSLFFAVILYGLQNIAIRIAGVDFDPFVSSSLRFLIVAIIISRFVAWKKIKNKDWTWFFLRSAGNIIATACLFIAVNRMPIGVALFALYSSMIISAALLGVVFYRERITPVKLISVLVTGFGLYLIYIDQTRFSYSKDIFIALFAGVGVSLWSVFSRPLSGKYSLKQLVFVDSLLAGIMAAIISVLLRESWQVFTPDLQMLAILFLGLTQVFTGQLVANGFRYVDAQVGSVIMLNDTVVTMILAFLIFRESVTVPVIFGGVCIFISSVIPVFFGKRKE